MEEGLWRECNGEGLWRGMQSRRVEAYCRRRAACAAEDFIINELVGGRGAATPAVCEPRPNC